MLKKIMDKKWYFSLTILCLLSICLVLTCQPVTVLAEEVSISSLVTGVADYYKNHKTNLEDWQEAVALRGAGVDVAQSPWVLPEWGIDALTLEAPATDFAARVLGIYASGQDPSNINGRNLLNELANKQQIDGSFGESLNNTIWSVIALDEAEATFDSNQAITYLIGQQKGDGGFALAGDVGDPDLTGMALLALAKHRDVPGVDGEAAAIPKALTFLHSVQREQSADFVSFGMPNAESNALVILGLSAVGEDPTSVTWQKAGCSVVDALLTYQLGDKSFCHSLNNQSTNYIATRQAFMALSSLKNGTIFYDLKGIPNSEPQTVKVKVRVEGATAELANTTVEIGGTALDALKAAVGAENIVDSGGFITSIMGENGQTAIAPNTDTGWKYYVIREGSIETGAFSSGAGSYNLQDGDQVVFYIGAYDTTTWNDKTFFSTVNIAPDNPKEGQPLNIGLVIQRYDWVAGLVDVGDYSAVRLHINDSVYLLSGSNPNLIITPAAGLLTIQVEKDDSYPNMVRQSKLINVATRTFSNSNLFTVSVKVIGKNNHIYYNGAINLVPEERNAFQALVKTGLQVEARDNNAYVFGIEGEREDRTVTAGWKYKVNGDIPNLSGVDKSLKNGDTIEWFWASTYTDTGTSKPIIIENLKLKEILVPAKAQAAEIDLTKFRVMVEEDNFADLTKEWDWAREAISALASRGIISGMQAGIFAPQEAVTRAQFYKLAALGLGWDTQSVGADDAAFQFKDINLNEWYVPYVSRAIQKGLAMGYGDGTFRPEASITREEMAVLMVRAMGKEEIVKNLKAELINPKLHFKDKELISPWARAYVAVAVDEKLLNGFDDLTFAPHQYVSRAEAAVIISRMLP